MKTDYDFERKKPYKKTNILFCMLIVLVGMVLASTLAWLILGGLSIIQLLHLIIEETI